MNGMNLIEFGGLFSDENRSLQYPCDKLNDLSCPSFGRKEFYFMSRQRLRCAKCSYDFRPFNGTSFSIIKLFAPKWLSLIKLLNYLYLQEELL
jgi:transposase-like protein